MTMLYVSIWKIGLSNLAGTAFSRRLLPVDEAASVIAQARAEQALMGVSASDLWAPYQQRSLDDHVQVCNALRARGVELVIEDFFNDRFCNPLQFARVMRGHRLLVVDVDFEVDVQSMRAIARSPRSEIAQGDEVARVSRLFKISAESLRFHLFEEISP